MPAMIRWSRSTPLTWVRRPASRAARVSTVKSAASGSGPSVATPGTSAGSRTRYTARRLCVPCSVRSNPAGPRARAGRRAALARLRRRRGEFLTPAQPACPGQVHDQVQALIGSEVHELTVPADFGDHLALEAGERRVERLQHRERGRVGPRDGVTRRVTAQEYGQRLHFRQFRHASQSATSGGKSVTRRGEARRRDPGLRCQQIGQFADVRQQVRPSARRSLPASSTSLSTPTTNRDPARWADRAPPSVPVTTARSRTSPMPSRRTAVRMRSGQGKPLATLSAHSTRSARSHQSRCSTIRA